MSGEDTFITRWSRLKREAAEGKTAHAEPGTAKPEPRGEQSPPGGAHQEVEPPFDPATLPPIESIVADTDIRAFLQKGVPAALTRAALRRAWSADPAIRDFIEIAENQWDFTNPATIPGFGDLDPTCNLDKLIAQATGKLQDVPDPLGLSEESREAEAGHRAEAPEPCAPEIDKDEEDQARIEISAAPQHSEPPPVDTAAPSRRGHGRALPR